MAALTPATSHTTRKSQAHPTKSNATTIPTPVDNAIAASAVAHGRMSKDSALLSFAFFLVLIFLSRSYGDGSSIKGSVFTDIFTVGNLTSQSTISLGGITSSTVGSDGFEPSGVDGIWGFGKYFFPFRMTLSGKDI